MIIAIGFINSDNGAAYRWSGNPVSILRVSRRF